MDKKIPFDLHLHTCWSYDASPAPEVYFKRAVEQELRAISITEHHNIDSMDECMQLAPLYPDLIYIRGVELSVTTSVGFVDMVCLGVPHNISNELQQLFDLYHDWQQEFGAATCTGMQALGFDYTEENRIEILHSYRPERVFPVQGNTHIKNEILRAYFIERGFAEDSVSYGNLFREMRAQGLLPGYPSAEKVVPVLKAGTILVFIAHPKGYFQERNKERMDLLCGELQLDGIECGHRTIEPELSRFYREYCVQHNLLSSAGSDTHEPDHMHSRFGSHYAQDEWLDEILERLGQ